MRRPNIVYFICHDLGKHLGCYGPPIVNPHLDAFASEGIVFTNTFCSAPACSPSRACGMTGQYAHVNGQLGLTHMGWPLPDETKTIVDYLNDGGYETAHFGITHERPAGKNRYQIDGEMDSRRSEPAEHAVSEAIDYLKNRNDGSKPVYLNIGTGEVHASRWKPNLDGTYGGAVPLDNAYVPLSCAYLPAFREYFSHLQSALRYLDTQFGRLLAAMDELKLSEDTIVIFTTDHGPFHTRGKGTVYHAGTGISFLMRLPSSMRNGYRVDHLMQNIDFMPTLLEAAGVAAPDDINGRSFWPLLLDQEYAPNPHIFVERNFHGEKPDPRVTGGPEALIDLYDPIRAVRSEDFLYLRNYGYKDKYVRKYWLPWEVDKTPDYVEPFNGLMLVPPSIEPRSFEELYHTAQDPQELFNLADRPEFAKIKQELAIKLDGWMQATNDHVLRGEVPERRFKPAYEH